MPGQVASSTQEGGRPEAKMCISALRGLSNIGRELPPPALHVQREKRAEGRGVEKAQHQQRGSRVQGLQPSADLE